MLSAFVSVWYGAAFVPLPVVSLPRLLDTNTPQESATGWVATLGMHEGAPLSAPPVPVPELEPETALDLEPELDVGAVPELAMLSVSELELEVAFAVLGQLTRLFAQSSGDVKKHPAP